MMEVMTEATKSSLQLAKLWFGEFLQQTRSRTHDVDLFWERAKSLPHQEQLEYDFLMRDGDRFTPACFQLTYLDGESYHCAVYMTF